MFFESRRFISALCSVLRMLLANAAYTVGFWESAGGVTAKSTSDFVLAMTDLGHAFFERPGKRNM